MYFSHGEGPLIMFSGFTCEPIMEAINSTPESSRPSVNTNLASPHSRTVSTIASWTMDLNSVSMGRYMRNTVGRTHTMTIAWTRLRITGPRGSATLNEPSSSSKKNISWQPSVKHEAASASVTAIISMNTHSRKSEFISTAPEEKDHRRVYGRIPHWTSASTPAKNTINPSLNRSGSVSRQSIGKRTSVTTKGRSENVMASSQPIGEAADAREP